MAVYATMIRDDPDSRARLRVTPEQLLNFPNYFCLASWIANGTRAPAFTGQTYPLPDSDDRWADHHLAEQAERVGPYPDELDSTLDTHASDVEPDSDDGSARRPPAEREYIAVPYEQKDDARRLGARWDAAARSWYIPEGVASEPFARWRDTSRTTPENGAAPNESADHDEARSADTAHGHARRSDGHGDREPRREVRVDYEPPPPPPNLADSPVRRIVGRRVPGPPPGQHDAPAPDSLRQLAFLDRINEIGPADQLDGAARLPRLYNEDYAILALLDRAGLVPRTLIGRAALPGRAPAASHRPADQALPPRADRPTPSRHPPAHPQRRQTATPVLAHPTRPRGRADPRAAGDLPQARMAADRTGTGAAPRARPPRARVGDRTPPPHRRRRDRPLAHPPLRHRPLPRPPDRLRPRPPPDHQQRDPRPRRPGDHRPRAQDLHRGQARPLARASHRRAEAHLRPARRARPHQPPLLQPRQAPRLRRVPMRLEPRPPTLPRPGHPTRCRVRVPQPPRRAGARPRSRPGAHRPDRRHGHRQPSTGTTRVATTPSSPSKPTSTTATSQRSPSPDGPPDYANASPEAATWRSSASRCCPRR